MAKKTKFKKEMIIIPTVTGGVLYRPISFHPIVFDPILRILTQYHDDNILTQIFVVSGGSGELLLD